MKLFKKNQFHLNLIPYLNISISLDFITYYRYDKAINFK